MVGVITYKGVLNLMELTLRNKVFILFYFYLLLPFSIYFLKFPCNLWPRGRQWWFLKYVHKFFDISPFERGLDLVTCFLWWEYDRSGGMSLARLGLRRPWLLFWVLSLSDHLFWGNACNEQPYGKTCVASCWASCQPSELKAEPLLPVKSAENYSSGQEFDCKLVREP